MFILRHLDRVQEKAKLLVKDGNVSNSTDLLEHLSVAIITDFA